MQYLQIESQPPALSLSGMPILFTLSSDRVEDFYKILALPFPDDPSAGGDFLFRNSENKVTFDLHEYFSRHSEFVLDDIYVHENHCWPATIEFSEYFGNPPEALNPLEATINILGGSIPRWKEHEFKKNYVSFNAYHLQEKPFLTWYPRLLKKVLPEQPERVYFLNRITQAIKLIVGVYFDDLSFALYNPDRQILAYEYQVYSFASGFNNLGLEAWAEVNHPGKTITHYYVAVTDAQGVALSESFLYQVNNDEYRNLRYIIFQNSLYGFDILPCTGEYDESSEVERMTAERIADVYDPGRLHKMEYDRRYSEIVKVNTGWLTQKEKKWLADLMISKEVYELKDGIMRRILIRTKAIDTTDRQFLPGDLELEYEPLFSAE